MTAYEHGFLTKCASSGVPEELAFYLLKTAKNPPKYEYAKPGYDIFGRPLAAPAPTVQQKADAAASGISTPATTMPRPVTRRATPASPYGAPDPANPHGTRTVTPTVRKPGDTGMTSNPAEAGVTAPAPGQPGTKYEYAKPRHDIFGRPLNSGATAQNTVATAPAQVPNDPLSQGSSEDPFAGQGTPSSQAIDPKTQTMGQWWKSMSQSDRKNLLSQNGMSVADFNRMDPAGRGKFLKSHYDAATDHRQPQQPQFQPNDQQQRMMAHWNSGTDEQRNAFLARMGMDQDTFNGLRDEAKYVVLEQMRENYRARQQNQRQAQRTAQNASASDEPYTFPNGDVWDKQTGMQMDRASYDRLMAARAGKGKINGLTPQQIQQNQLNAIGQGWKNQYAEQEKRMAQTRGRQPRDANGNLQTINLAGNAVSPYSSRAGVRGIKPAVGG